MATMAPRTKSPPPSLMVGQPFVPPVALPRPDQISPEDANIVTDSGKVIARIGKGETLRVIPPGQADPAAAGGDPLASMAPRMGSEGGNVPGYATGGDLLAGYSGRSFDEITGTDYLNDDERYYYLSTRLQQGASLDQNALDFVNNYTPSWAQQQAPAPQQQQGGGDLTQVGSTFTSPGGSATVTAYTPGATATGPLADQLAATRATIAAQQAALNARGTANTADKATIEARQATIAPQRNQINAARDVVGAEETYSGVQRGNIAMEQGINQQRLAEQEAINAASNNTADKAAVASAQAYRNYEAGQYARAGVPLVEMETPTGADNSLPGNVPSNVRAKLETQQSLLEKVQNMDEKKRAILLDQARLALQMEGTNVDAARRKATLAGLTLDEARLAVQIAENNAGLLQNSAIAAGLEADKAALNEKSLTLPPQAGMVMYTDPVTLSSSWMTPSERAAKEAQDARNQNLAEPGTVLWTDPKTGKSEYVTRQERDMREIEYQRNLGLATADRKYGDDELGSFSPDYIARLVTQGFVDQQQYYRILTAPPPQGRGLTQAQADGILLNAFSSQNTGLGGISLT